MITEKDIYTTHEYFIDSKTIVYRACLSISKTATLAADLPVPAIVEREVKAHLKQLVLSHAYNDALIELINLKRLLIPLIKAEDQSVSILDQLDKLQKLLQGDKP